MADVSDCNSNTAAVSMDEVMVSVDIQAGRRRGRVLHRVPEYMRENKKHIYDPVVLSLGPYHYGRTQQFHLAEKVKDKVVDIVCGATDRGFLLSKIGERVEEIRHYFYGSGAEECCYSDEQLAEMMLRDACFNLFYMEMLSSIDNPSYGFLFRRLGISGYLHLSNDFLMLENQIPLWFIKLVFSLIHFGERDKDDKFRRLLRDFLSITALAGCRMTRLPWKDDGEEEPLHLLEAFILANFNQDPSKVREKRSEDISFLKIASSIGTVTDLKAKGIHFGPSSYYMKDIKFYSPKLLLPIYIATIDDQVFFSNAIAFEMSPGSPLDLNVTSYVKFMKMLIGDAKDVKELREKGILYNMLGSDEEVVRVLQGVDTYGFDRADLFYDVKESIEKHCNSKAKTWMAELISTYFRSPWTAIALFAAIAVLTLTFLQTYYTIIHSP